MKHKTSELIGAALDVAVARATPSFQYKLMEHVDYPDEEHWVMCDDGVIRHHVEDQSWTGRSRRYDKEDWAPSTNWSQGGPIIERERITLLDPGFNCKNTYAQRQQFTDWEAFIGHQIDYGEIYLRDGETPVFINGPTPLIAAMRCYVQSKLGDTVDIPE